MALSNYTELQAAIASWLNRTDLITEIVDFIVLAESKINRKLRHPEMLTRDDAFTVDSQYETVPTGFLAAKTFYLATAPITPLDGITPDQMMEWREGLSSSSTPRYYTASGGNFEFLPEPGQSFTAKLLYWKRIDPLATTATNWLLTSHPDVYLFGALTEAEPFIKNDERFPLWQARWEAALQEVKVHGQRMEMGSRPRYRQTRAIG